MAQNMHFYRGITLGRNPPWSKIARGVLSPTRETHGGGVLRSILSTKKHRWVGWALTDTENYTFGEVLYLVVTNTPGGLSSLIINPRRSVQLTCVGG